MRLAKQLQIRRNVIYIISFVPYSISINHTPKETKMNHTQSPL